MRPEEHVTSQTLRRNAEHIPQELWPPPAESVRGGPANFVVKDSGQREEFESGMRRDTEEGKVDFTLVYDGPLFGRLAAHLTKGAEKYGARNWQLAESLEEAERFRRSAVRHFHQWLNGELDEDHMSAVVFNMNAHEYVLERCGKRRIQDFREEYGG